MENTTENLIRSGLQDTLTDVALPANVELTFIGNAYTRVCVVTALEKGCLLPEWILQHAGFVTALYERQRALLFRGFYSLGKEGLAQVVKLTSDGGALTYAEPSTPRTRLGDAVYTSTEYPKDQHIPQHNEHSYSGFWPKKLFFYCESAASTGGQTPICNSEAVLKQIPAAVVDRFESKGGVMYVRNFSDEMDISWKDFFGTTDKREVEAYCKEKKMSYKWLDNNQLRLSQIAQATIVDRRSGAKIWFNQAHLFHSSNLNTEVMRYLVDAYGENHLPRNAYLADGTPISTGDMEAIRNAYDQVMFRFDWEDGDLLMMDNLAYTHGRDPYTGSRSLLVAMSEEDGIDNYPESIPHMHFDNPTPENSGVHEEDIVANSRQTTSKHFFLKESRFDNSKVMLKYKLALSCRLLRMLELDEGSISGHISLKVPGSQNLFWVNPFGVLFDEVTPDNLVMVDENGVVVEGDHPVNVAGFCIHSSIHQANKDVSCIVHTHSPWGTLFSAFADCSILPIDQNSCMFYDNHVVYRDFDGPVNNLGSAHKLADALQGKNVAILANHGALTCGDELETAVMYMVCLERALRLNVKARELNTDLRLVDAATALASREWIANPLGFKIEFDALARRVERQYPDITDYYPQSIDI
ncbi:class II aldolase/adducin family protein [Chitinophaga sp.]|uniref:class II aldolase/adducin family protein n=1 Tax=Chitinophaga sp. TaxID=1869181 RepID=UPI002C040834|nr:class II aldolase/adducin family protein [Chitinophaga sp.]HWV64268.1 class II aldolase/adducin family protein [Chitinophaga sp.]